MNILQFVQKKDVIKGNLYAPF